MRAKDSGPDPDRNVKRCASSPLNFKQHFVHKILFIDTFDKLNMNTPEVKCSLGQVVNINAQISLTDTFAQCSSRSQCKFVKGF